MHICFSRICLQSFFFKYMAMESMITSNSELEVLPSHIIYISSNTSNTIIINYVFVVCTFCESVLYENTQSIIRYYRDGQRYRCHDQNILHIFCFVIFRFVCHNVKIIVISLYSDLNLLSIIILLLAVNKSSNSGLRYFAQICNR